MMSFQFITTVFVHPIWRIRPATKPIFQGTHSETNPPSPPKHFPSVEMLCSFRCDATREQGGAQSLLTIFPFSASWSLYPG